MAEAARVEEADVLYRQMRCSLGGVMLWVRLHADLAAQPAEFVRRMRTADLHPDPGSLLPSGSRLAVTYSWLVRKFGRGNAARALVEVAGEVLSARAIRSGDAAR